MSGTLEGQVLDQKNGQPIDGAEIAMTGESEVKTTTGEKGAFRFADLKEGSYELVASKAGFEDGLYGPLMVMPDGATKITVALQPKV